MPLTGNPSHDIPVERAAGKPEKQAVAIALSEQRRKGKDMEELTPIGDKAKPWTDEQENEYRKAFHKHYTQMSAAYGGRREGDPVDRRLKEQAHKLALKDIEKLTPIGDAEKYAEEGNELLPIPSQSLNRAEDYSIGSQRDKLEQRLSKIKSRATPEELEAVNKALRTNSLTAASHLLNKLETKRAEDAEREYFKKGQTLYIDPNYKGGFGGQSGQVTAISGDERYYTLGLKSGGRAKFLFNVLRSSPWPGQATDDFEEEGFGEGAGPSKPWHDLTPIGDAYAPYDSALNDLTQARKEYERVSGRIAGPKPPRAGEHTGPAEVAAAKFRDAEKQYSKVLKEMSVKGMNEISSGFARIFGKDELTPIGDAAHSREALNALNQARKDYERISGRTAGATPPKPGEHTGPAEVAASKFRDAYKHYAKMAQEELSAFERKVESRIGDATPIGDKWDKVKEQAYFKRRKELEAQGKSKVEAHEQAMKELDSDRANDAASVPDKHYAKWQRAKLNAEKQTNSSASIYESAQIAYEAGNYVYADRLLAKADEAANNGSARDSSIETVRQMRNKLFNVNNQNESASKYYPQHAKSGETVEQMRHRLFKEVEQDKPFNAKDRANDGYTTTSNSTLTQKCTGCNGTGRKMISGQNRVCPQCDGTGKSKRVYKAYDAEVTPI